MKTESNLENLEISNLEFQFKELGDPAESFLAQYQVTYLMNLKLMSLVGEVSYTSLKAKEMW